MAYKMMDYYLDLDKRIIVAKIEVSKRELADEIATRIYKDFYVNQFAQGDEYRMKKKLARLIDYFCFENKDPRIKINGYREFIEFIGKATTNENDEFDLDFGKALAHDRALKKLNVFKREIASNAISFFSHIARAADIITDSYIYKIGKYEKGIYDKINSVN